MHSRAAELGSFRWFFSHQTQDWLIGSRVGTATHQGRNWLGARLLPRSMPVEQTQTRHVQIWGVCVCVVWGDPSITCYGGPFLNEPHFWVICFLKGLLRRRTNGAQERTCFATANGQSSTVTEPPGFKSSESGKPVATATENERR